MRQYRQGLQVSIELISDCIWALAYITVFYISLNVFSEARPRVFPADEVFSFIDTKMSC